MVSTIMQATFLPVWGVLLCVGVLGAIIGSFLNVYLYRFHTGKSLNGRSHCLSCGIGLRWFELLPIGSYVCLRGRCRSCHSRITPRYLVVEVITAGLFLVASLQAASVLEFVWLAAVLVLLLLTTAYDYYHYIIPDEFVVALLLLIGGWVGLGWWSGTTSLESLWYTIGAALAGAAFFWLLWVVSRGQWLGFGDVKLALPLGLWVGPSLVFSFVVWSFWIGAGVSVLLLLWQRVGRGQRRLHLSGKTLTMKTAVPFAPFLIASAVLVYFFQIHVLTLFY